MTFTAVIRSRGVRYFLLVLLSIFVVSLYYFLLFDTQQQKSLMNKQTHFHHLLHQNADADIALIDGEKRDWKYAETGSLTKKSDESSILLGAINSSSEVMLISTLVARLSSQLQQMGLSFVSSSSSSSRLLCPIISPKLSRFKM
uniref:Uncharacterized protein n=1 Tax=Daphnia galeata TaxID=27404 RepID=A0A8J2WU80_9CRUS|nr:unnamed protein product [Daphnia galeata]